MRIKQIKLSAILLLGFGLTGLHAQESINASGSNASGSGGSVSWSVGQVACQTHTGTSGSVTEGVQQPYAIWTEIATKEAQSINLTFTAYPNPTNDYLILEVNDFELSTLTFHLYDMNGKLLQKEKITDNQTRIVIGHLVPATYFVKVIQGNKKVKTFNVIKN
jgi:hypothetical protein